MLEKSKEKKITIIFVPRIMTNTASFVVVKTALYEPTSKVGDAIKCELLLIHSKILSQRLFIVAAIVPKSSIVPRNPTSLLSSSSDNAR